MYGLAWRSLRFHRRTNFGVAAGVAVAAAVLIGALTVGDSVKATLREQALARIGGIDVAMLTGDRYVRETLADAVKAAPALRINGVAATPNGDGRANDVQVMGVDERFFELAPEATTPPDRGDVLLNERLARQLGVDVGASILLRIEKPSALPRDMVLAQNDELTIGLRVNVDRIIGDESFGRFGLEANQVPPFNAFVDLAWLQEQLELDGRVNALLASGIDVAAADAALGDAWTIADAGIELVDETDLGVVDTLSSRVFLDEPIIDAATEHVPNATGVLTYFVNEIRHGDRTTPYSMVTAIGTLDGGHAGWFFKPMANTVVINRWLADDLEADVGDTIDMTYFVLGETRRLEEVTTSFAIERIVELEGAAADPTLMPDFPGLSNADHCRDWEPGIPLDMDAIRDKDEDYWDEHRGTPKAFITLAAGRELWGNRFGSLTSIRSTPDEADRIETLHENIDPASLGLFFHDIRETALAASTSATDFGGLFLGLSFFLIVSALLLVSMLFALGVQHRASEVGSLLAVGWKPRAVLFLMMREASLIAMFGAVVGVGLALVYTKLVLVGLATVWSDAIGATAIEFRPKGMTLLMGAEITVIAACTAIWLAVRKQIKRPAVDLLAGRTGDDVGAVPKRPKHSSMVAVVCLLGAIAIVATTGADRGAAAAGAFFSAGMMLLVAIIAGSRAVMVRLARSTAAKLSVGMLGVRNGMRRASRSLAVIALVACGTFLVMAVGANRLDANVDANERSSGTGGFALIAHSAVGVPHDLESDEGRESLGIEDLTDVTFVSMRVREGDDASCLNLSLSRQPRVLGVDPDALASREAFSFASTVDETDAPWSLLDDALPLEDGIPVYPAIGDAASLAWAMHLSIGDTLEMRDGQGKPFKVKIVGGVANSILQGNLLINERHFRALYPGASGYRMFLVDAPAEEVDDVAKTLTRMMSDVGLEVTPTTTRLAEFNAVQNTYLAIFQVLGGLGLLLGCVGLGTVVLRNVLERRSELGLLRAVGFHAKALRWLIFSEHALLLALGAGGGTAAALLAALPALRSPSAEPPVVWSLLLLLTVLVTGAIWVSLATAWGLRGRVIDALRDE